MLIFLLMAVSCFTLYPMEVIAKDIQSEQQIDNHHWSLKVSLEQTFELDKDTAIIKNAWFNFINSSLETCSYKYWSVKSLSVFDKKCFWLIKNAKAVGISYPLLKKVIKDKRQMSKERKRYIQNFISQIYGKMSEGNIKEADKVTQSLIVKFQSCINETWHDSIDPCKVLIKTAREKGVSYFQLGYAIKEAVSELKQQMAKQPSDQQIAKQFDAEKNQPPVQQVFQP